MKRKQILSSFILGVLCISLFLPSIHAKATRKDEILSYLDQCEMDSTFMNTPGDSVPTMEATYQGLYLLNLFNKLSRITSTDIIEFVNSCRNSDNGFGNTPEANSDIFSTYYAVWIFNLLGVEMYNETFEWIAELQNGTVGFSYAVNENISLYATYYGLEALFMNSTDLTNYNISSWLLNRQNINSASDGYGGFATDGNSSNIWATWAAMGAIDRLNISRVFLVEPLVTWINSSQNLNSLEDEYGDFSSGPGEDDYSMLHLYAAVASLHWLGDAYLSRINTEAALNLLLNLQNTDGGFRVNSLEAPSSLSTTYYAVCSFDLLGEISKLNESAPWIYGFELPLWLWVLIGAIIAVTAILLIRKYYIY
ncbi:MAG: prenyltransferase/squalene oxidase repeat-containing protein [Candidatus Helarchaeota archaeon]